MTRALAGPVGLLVLAAATSIGAPRPASASVVLALDLDELVAQSDEIVVAEVLSQSASWVGRRIETDVRLRVDETVFGSSRRGNVIVVRRIGGNVGEIGMRVEGEPTFVVGQRTLLFLRRAYGILRVVGMSQGAMRIEPGTPPIVHPGGAGLALVRRSATGAMEDVDPASLPQSRPLAEMLDDVRSAVAARRPPTLTPSTPTGAPTGR
ncbi:MAG: hypothetical protein IT379_18010 [Deltaproteobacteria bacterium]|nr:hypothetical protein [Deltaproteobacteria bacterium]